MQVDWKRHTVLATTDDFLGNTVVAVYIIIIITVVAIDAIVTELNY